MTNEQNALIATRLAGYEVQVSPAGKWYVVTGDETKPLVDYETDWAEAITTLIAVCRSRKWHWEIGEDPDNTGFQKWVFIGEYEEFGTCYHLPIIARCLLQIAEGEE